MTPRTGFIASVPFVFERVVNREEGEFWRIRSHGFLLRWVFSFRIVLCLLR